MHDPKWVAFDINLPFYKNKHGSPLTLATIWHVDPEKDGTDDSCGSFIRERHLPKDLVEKVKSDFEFNHKNNYWYDLIGTAKFSESGMALLMYKTAAWAYFGKDRKKQDAFFRKHLHHILFFAENDVDSIVDDLRVLRRPISQLAGIILADIARLERRWYQHPRWHFWHWEIQLVFFRDLYNRYWRKCDQCGKRGSKNSWHTDFKNGKKIHVCGRHAAVSENLPLL